MITKIPNYHHIYYPGSIYKQNALRHCQNVSFKNASNDNKMPEDNDTDLFESDIFKDNEEIPKEENNYKKKAYLGIGGLLAAAIGLFLYFKTNKNKLNHSKQINIKEFHSLADDKQVPLLSECKSLNKALKNFLELQLNYSKASDSIKKRTGKIHPAREILMWGPPGTGKSFFAKIFAKTLDADYMEIKTADIDGTKYAGVGIERINETFEYIMKESMKRPNKKFVVTINEIDSLILPLESLTGGASFGGHVITKIEERAAVIDWLDTIKSQRPNVIIIGTTNNTPKKGNIDSAILSRFGKKIGLDFPDKEFLLEALKDKLLQMEGGKDFINNNIGKLEEFSQKLASRKASFRDLDNIIDLSKNFYLEDMMVNENVKFKLEYLEKGMHDLDMTDGEIFAKNK